MWRALVVCLLFSPYTLAQKHAEVLTPPDTPPPQLVVIRDLEHSKGIVRIVRWEPAPTSDKTLRRYQKKDGASVVQNVPVTEWALQPKAHELKWKDLRVYDADGNRLSAGDALHRLKPGEAVYLASSPTPVDPVWRKGLAKDALILQPGDKPSALPPIEPSAVAPTPPHEKPSR